MRQSLETHLKENLPRFYQPELDVLRFLAFLLVFFSHTFPDNSSLGASIKHACPCGVCLFFLLSAYLITELLRRESTATGTIDLRAFYLRRILRIWPLYFGFLFFGYLLDHINGSDNLTPGTLLAFVFLAGNWYTAKYGFVASFIAPLWSISVEEQFYLIWPSLRRFCSPYVALIAAFSTLPVAYLAIKWLFHHKTTLPTQIWVNTLVQAQFFGIGAIIALFLKGHIPRLRSALRLGFFILGILVLFIAQLLFHVPGPEPASLHNTYCGYLCFAIGCTLLFFSFLGSPLLSTWRPIIYLGKISYGLYVFHQLAVRLTVRTVTPAFLAFHFNGTLALLIQLVTAFFTCVLLAHLSYRYFESPFLRLKERFSTVRTRDI
jgi:peptidoglycan/LPS O-acetylase OafA/YrhL